MGDIRSIPSRLLIHTIEYQEFKGEGTYGPEYEAPEKIGNVLVQMSTEIVIDSTSGEEVQAKGVIYLDPVNTPNYKPLKVKSIVRFQGEQYMVQGRGSHFTVSPDTPHHTKVVII